MKNICEVWHSSLNDLIIWSVKHDIDIWLTENSEDEGLHIPNHPGRVRRRLPPAPADDDDTCSKCKNILGVWIIYFMLQFFFLSKNSMNILYSKDWV